MTQNYNCNRTPITVFQNSFFLKFFKNMVFLPNCSLIYDFFSHLMKNDENVLRHIISCFLSIISHSSDCVAVCLNSRHEIF